MTVEIHSDTVLSALWGGDETVSSTAVDAKGHFLHIQLAANTTQVTCVVFHPVDETCFAMGTSSGTAYGVSLQDNKLFLLASLESSLRAAIFCPGYLASPIVLFLLRGNRLVFVDWQRGVILQDVHASVHERPILHLATGLSTDALFACVSADAISCWEPLPTEAMTGITSSTAYTCTSSALPTLCTLQLENSMKAPPPRDPSWWSSHRFSAIHIIDPTLLLSVEGDGVVSRWVRRGGDEVHSSEEVWDSSRAPAGTASVAASSLKLLSTVQMPLSLTVLCSAGCSAFLALGAESLFPDGKHREPVVALIDPHTLGGRGVVRLPIKHGGHSYQPQQTSLRRSTKTSTPTVVQIHTIQSDLVACLMSSGVVHVVLPTTFHLVFSIAPPNGGVVRHFGHPMRWLFCPSGPTFAAYWSGQSLVLLHFPTARRGTVTPGLLISTSEAESRTMQTTPKETGWNGQSAAEYRPLSQPLHHDAAPTMALPFLHERLSSASPLEVGGQGDKKSGASPPRGRFDGAEKGQSVVEALETIATPRPPLSLNRKGKRGGVLTWLDAHAIHGEGNQRHRSSFRGTDAIREEEEAADGEVAARKSFLRIWDQAKFADTLSAASCSYNCAQLRGYLAKYGIFPAAYRPTIWRFIMGLPSKSRTAAQLAALARRPRHVCVERLMEPYPLSVPEVRAAVESALSCLAWVSPVLTLATYLPALVYPLVVLYENNVQTAVEAVLIFFWNWGQEYFVCHPNGPAVLLAAMAEQMRQQDEELYQHLTTIGADVEVWGWELMTTFYTDVLTGPEWLQLMDHAFCMAPIWLFAFHISLLTVYLRPGIIVAQSVDEVRGILRQHPHRGTPMGNHLQLTLTSAYDLYRQWLTSEDPMMAGFSSYMKFRPFTSTFEYPSVFPHDPVVLNEKLRELALLHRSLEEEQLAQQNFSKLRKEAEAASMKEALFLQQQRARVAAKYDASAASWRVHVDIERARQERAAVERQMRWTALQERTSNAESLATLAAETQLIESQMRHDMVDRHMEQLKWGLATHLTDKELARLERAAEDQVDRVIAGTLATAQAEAAAAPLQPINVLVVREDEGVQTVEECRGSSVYTDSSTMARLGTASNEPLPGNAEQFFHRVPSRADAATSTDLLASLIGHQGEEQEADGQFVANHAVMEQHSSTASNRTASCKGLNAADRTAEEVEQHPSQAKSSSAHSLGSTVHQSRDAERGGVTAPSSLSPICWTSDGREQMAEWGAPLHQPSARQAHRRRASGRLYPTHLSTPSTKEQVKHRFLELQAQVGKRLEASPVLGPAPHRYSCEDTGLNSGSRFQTAPSTVDQGSLHSVTAPQTYTETLSRHSLGRQGQLFDNLHRNNGTMRTGTGETENSSYYYSYYYTGTTRDSRDGDGWSASSHPTTQTPLRSYERSTEAATTPQITEYR